MRPDHVVFLETLQRKFGEPTVIRPMESPRSGEPPVFSFIYHDTPEAGMITGVTYGLSLAEHPNWTEARRELVICVESDDETWPLAVAYFAAAFRGEQEFEYGSLFTLDGPIADGSEMTAFFIYAPSILNADQCMIELSTMRIELAGLYPLYPGEVPLFREIGAEAFFQLDGFDMYDVRRRDLSRET